MTCPVESRVGMDEQSNSGSASAAGASEASEWKKLVDKIQAGQPEGMEELYQVFGRGVRYYLYRQLGPQDLDDKVHDTFLIVVQAIANGDIRDPERLMGFVRTVVRRRVASHIDEAVHARREQTNVDSGIVLVDRKTSPEDSAIGEEQKEILTKVLRGMASRDRQILTRFYLEEQPQEQICEEMNLSSTQFRLLKSRAKARFGELGRRRLEKKPAEKVLTRNVSSLQH